MRRAYEVFPDASLFLEWCKRHKLITGVTSNGDERYRDGVLPMLGLDEELDFVVLSKEVGVEKPAWPIYEQTLKKAGVAHPSEILHIGDNLDVDYLAPKRGGYRALLLDRFGTEKATKWRREGYPVLDDLMDAIEWIVRWNLVPPREDAPPSQEV